DDAIRRLIRIVLQRCGYKVLEAANGPAALALSDTHGGPVHLLITDLVMPGLSGRMLTEALAPARPAMKGLYMSGYTEDLIVHQGVDSATAHFLPKPFSPPALTKKVREVLGRG